MIVDGVGDWQALSPFPHLIFESCHTTISVPLT
nr:MAG TPA: hypothetical protein [Caudoviricetes sp.]